MEDFVTDGTVAFYDAAVFILGCRFKLLVSLVSFHRQQVHPVGSCRDRNHPSEISFFHDRVNTYSERPEYDFNEELGMSVGLEIPGDTILITPEMIGRAETISGLDADPDAAAVAAVRT